MLEEETVTDTLDIDEAVTVFDKILSSAEKQLPGKSFEDASLYQHDPFTMACVRVGSREGIGFSKCAPCDMFDRALGAKLATKRALAAFFRAPALEINL